MAMRAPTPISSLVTFKYFGYSWSIYYFN